jgi:hypothetical protein
LPIKPGIALTAGRILNKSLIPALSKGERAEISLSLKVLSRGFR